MSMTMFNHIKPDLRAFGLTQERRTMAQNSQKAAKKEKNEIGLNEVKGTFYTSWIHIGLGYEPLFS